MPPYIVDYTAVRRKPASAGQEQELDVKKANELLADASDFADVEHCGEEHTLHPATAEQVTLTPNPALNALATVMREIVRPGPTSKPRAKKSKPNFDALAKVWQFTPATHETDPYEMLSQALKPTRPGQACAADFNLPEVRSLPRLVDKLSRN